jgi:hypothetical protein
MKPGRHTINWTASRPQHQREKEREVNDKNPFALYFMTRPKR